MRITSTHVVISRGEARVARNKSHAGEPYALRVPVALQKPVLQSVKRSIADARLYSYQEHTYFSSFLL